MRNSSSEKQSSNQIGEAYERLVERLTEWAEKRNDVRAVIVVGSRARADHPADEWADLDVLLIVTDAEPFVSKADWVGNMGKPLLTFLEPTAGGGETERRVLFEGMLDVDFAVIPVKNAEKLVQEWSKPETSVALVNVFGRGMRVLLDKDGITEHVQKLLSSVKKPEPKPPTQAEFLQVVNDFFYHAVFTAKHVRRGELWWAKMSSDCYMQHLLLQMVEWHARALHGSDFDTWFRGRFLEEWADPRVLEALRSAFAYYDEKDVRRGLLALMDLFGLIAEETAEKLGHEYPSEVDKRIKEWIGNCLTGV